MRTVAAIALLAALVTTESAFAQQTPAQAAQLNRGERKIKIGLALVGVGAIMGPITAGVSNDKPDTPALFAGVGLMAVGGGIVLLGTREQRRAVRPQTTLGFAVTGRSKGIQLLRAW